MDSDIAVAARVHQKRTGRPCLESWPSAAPVRTAPCRNAGEDYCERFGMFVTPDVCPACKVADPGTRAETLQRLMSAAALATAGPPDCTQRSEPIGSRVTGCGPDAGGTTDVFLCRRDGAKVTAANCILCVRDREEAQRPQRLPSMFRVLNTGLTPSVPTVPTAKPEVKVLDLHGEFVALDVNSLCAVHVDGRIAAALRRDGGETFHGLLFSRRKPQFRLPRAVPVRRVVLNVTHACNLACVYCFAGGDRPVPPMSLEIARKGLRLLDPRGAVDVAFFGGEPLMAWDLIRRVMTEARALAQKRKVRAKFHITTNGLLLDAGTIRFLSEQPCSLLVSLDGPEAIHNAARPARDPDTNSFRETLAALERARDAGLGQRVMARATFVARDPQLVRRIEFLAGLEDAGLIHGFSVEPAVLGEGCARRGGGLDKKAVAGEYHAAAQWFVRRIRAGRSANFFHFRKLLRRILSAQHTGTECGAGKGYVTVGTDGTLYACHREAGTAIGHVDYGFDEQARAPWADNRVYARNGCMRCWARYLCGGGCRQASLELAGDLHAAAPERCFLQQTMLRECFWILTQLTRDEVARVVTP